MALISTFKSLQPAKAVALIWISKSSQLGQCPAQNWVSMRGCQRDMINIEIMHFHLDFTEQLNRLAEAFHKYEIDEVKLDKYSKNDLKCPFLGPGLPAVCGLWVQQRGPALQEWPSGQDGLHCHEVSVFPIYHCWSWWNKDVELFTSINKFQNHCHSWEQLPLWRWQVSSGKDIFLQNWLNAWRNASFFRTFCKPLKQAPVGSHAITSENSAERIR